MLWWLHTCKRTKRTKKKGTKIVFLISKPNQNNAVTDVREEELNGIESAKDKAKDTFRHWLPVWSPLYRRKCHQQRMSPSKTERERGAIALGISTQQPQQLRFCWLYFLLLFSLNFWCLFQRLNDPDWNRVWLSLSEDSMPIISK